jgi:hypothetical protein
MVTLFEFVIGQDAWSIAVLGIMLNLGMVIFQIVKFFQTRRFVKSYERLRAAEEDES